MFNFSTWWHDLNGLEQVFWSSSMILSLLSIIQVALYVVAKTEDDEPEPPLRLTSPFTFLSFLTLFSWTLSTSFTMGLVLSFAIVLSAIISLLIVLIIFFLMQSVLKKEVVLNTEAILNHTGQVFNNIPPHHTGQGRVRLNIEGRILELNAETDGLSLTVGEAVRVIQILDDQHTLLVEPTRPPDKIA